MRKKFDLIWCDLGGLDHYLVQQELLFPLLSDRMGSYIIFHSTLSNVHGMAFLNQLKLSIQQGHLQGFELISLFEPHKMRQNSCTIIRNQEEFRIGFIAKDHNEKIKLAVTGCLGRMGQQIIKSAKLNKNFSINVITESKLINKKINGVNISLNNEKSFKKADVIIDFTVPKCTMEVLKIATKLKKRVVIGTTGFTIKEEKIDSTLL